MDKNTIIGFLLMGAVLFGFSWLNKPNEEQLKKVQAYNDSIALVQQEQQAKLMLEQARAEQAEAALLEAQVDGDSLRQVKLRNDFGAFANALEGEEKFVTLANEYLTLSFSTKGGAIYEARLNDYNSFDSIPAVLFTGKESSFGFQFPMGNQVLDTQSFYFTPILNGNTLTMHLDLEDGSYFNLVYTLAPESYMLDVAIQQSGMQQVLPLNTVAMDLYWMQDLRRQERGRKFEERNSGLYYNTGNSVESLSASGDASKSVNTRTKWIGYKNQFFSSVLIADGTFNYANLTSIEDSEADYLKTFRTETNFNYDPTSTQPASFKMFLGPNSYPLLNGYDDDLKGDNKLKLDELVPLGFKLFRWINTGFVIPMFSFLSKYIGNFGIIILIMTLVIKLILSPLTYKSYLSTARMRVLRPEIEEINKKYPGDDKAMDRQKATMDIYSKAGVNPMSGCLPMLLQMPILLAMFAFFPSSIELRGESFLWAHDLSSYDSIISWNTYIPLVTPYFGNHISLFCLLMTITNIVYSKINMDMQGQQQMPGMKMMTYMMPVMFLFIFNNYAAGLSYYYFISTLITIIQTYAFRKAIDEEKVLATLRSNQKKPRKKSGFMARLEEAQRQQQAALKEQQKKNKR